MKKITEFDVTSDGFGQSWPMYKGTELKVSTNEVEDGVFYPKVSLVVKKNVKVEVVIADKESKKLKVKVPKLIQKLLKDVKLEDLEVTFKVPFYSWSTKHVQRSNTKGRWVKHDSTKVVLKNGKLSFGGIKQKVTEDNLAKVLKKAVVYSEPVSDGC